MKKIIVCILLILSLLSLGQARTPEGKVTGMTFVAGLCSLIIWPGIGQAINYDTQDKVVGHAIFGLVDVVTKVPIARLWSGFDALINRRGGYLEGKI